MFETFYATIAQISFALLGLWWVVIQIKYSDFIKDAAMRRTAYNISLYFVVPGIMSLLSLLSQDLTILWRSSFIVAGAIGALETVILILRGGALGGTGAARIARWAIVVLYLVIIFFAAFPEILQSRGIPPRLVEGVLLSLVAVLGAQLAWLYFADTGKKDSNENLVI
jgi:hypothetical protein